MANIGIKTMLKLNYQPQVVQHPNTQKKSMSVSSFKLVVQLTNSDWKIFEGWRGVAEHKRVGKAQGAALKNFPSLSKTGPVRFCQRLI